MSISSSSVTVGTTPTLISTGIRRSLHDTQWVDIANPSGGVTIYLGGPNVTTSNGRPVVAGASWSATLGPDDVLYACVSSGSQAINVIQSRQ